MSTNRREVKAPPEEVWRVLSDGWLYAIWVVGAARMRNVDDHWPAVGARLHHSVGVWPALIDDDTEVLEVNPGRRLKLRGRGWPAGEAAIIITLTPSAKGTVVEIEEDAVKGPGVLVPKLVRTGMLHWRNTETLRRLGNIVENRKHRGA